MCLNWQYAIYFKNLFSGRINRYCDVGGVDRKSRLLKNKTFAFETLENRNRFTVGNNRSTDYNDSDSTRDKRNCICTIVSYHFNQQPNRLFEKKVDEK